MMLAIGVGASEYPELDVPEGMDVVDMEEGEDKEIVAKVRKKGDKLCLVEVNGIELGESDVDGQEEEWEDEESYEDTDSSEATDAAEMDSIGGGARAMGLI